MKEIINVKEHIIEVTIELIEKYDGDKKSITSRMIAEKAEVGLRLINYYFRSKDNLITECVQRIIGNVISGVNMKNDWNNDKDRLTAWATYVFNFFFEHSAISRISIPGDFQNYTANCNSVLSQHGFALAITNDISEENKPILTFLPQCKLHFQEMKQ